METSEFLKDCMAGAVMRLLEQYPLDKIQVKQICDVSGYHRASWFRAFRSKSEAVTYYMVRLWQLYCERHGLKGHNDWVVDNDEAWFQYNYEIRDTLRLLWRRGLMKELVDSFSATLHDHHIADPVRAYHTSMFAFSLYGTLREWIIRDFDIPPLEMAAIMRDATVSMM
ncbi:MAG: hypothetical protein IKG81_05580 [Bacteroidales bacterium]|nr:hypothetical protein [Bacteroidales bacterium]